MHRASTVFLFHRRVLVSFISERWSTNVNKLQRCFNMPRHISNVLSRVDESAMSFAFLSSLDNRVQMENRIFYRITFIIQTRRIRPGIARWVSDRVLIVHRHRLYWQSRKKNEKKVLIEGRHRDTLTHTQNIPFSRSLKKESTGESKRRDFRQGPPRDCLCRVSDRECLAFSWWNAFSSPNRSFLVEVSSIELVYSKYLEDSCRTDRDIRNFLREIERG